MSIVTQFAQHYGLIAVAVLILFESAGVPLPGETILLLTAATSTHWTYSGAIIMTATLAAILGDTLGYWVGHRYGTAVFERYGHWVALTPQHLNQAQAFMVRHGPKAVFWGRFVAVLRIFAATFAGVSRMPYGVFLQYNALGALTWATSMVVIGYVFGQSLPLIQQTIHVAGSVVVGIGVAILLGGVIWRHYRERA